MTLAASLLDPSGVLETWGTIGLFVIVFVESGLLVGCVLPGDSLLFTAGLLASRGRFNLAVLVVGCAACAIAGDQVGYGIGRRVGPRLLGRHNRIVTPARIERAEEFFVDHGGRAVLLARFVPVVRTFTPVLAGVGRMPYRSFVGWNVGGGVLWGSGVVLLGFTLGEVVPDAERYLLPMIAAIVLASLVPVLVEAKRARHSAQDKEASCTSS